MYVPTVKDKRFHSTSIDDRQLPFLDSRSAVGVAVAVTEESSSFPAAAGCGVGVAVAGTEESSSSLAAAGCGVGVAVAVTEESSSLSPAAAGCGVGVAARRRRRLSVSNEAQEYNMILLLKDKRFHSTSIADRQLPFLDSRSAAGVAVAVTEESSSPAAAGCGVGVAVAVTEESSAGWGWRWQ